MPTALPKITEQPDQSSYKVDGFPHELIFRRDFVRPDPDELIREYWQNHPRFSFLKMTVPGCRLLDVGSNDGGLSFWKEYGVPVRRDIRMSGLDLSIAQHANR